MHPTKPLPLLRTPIAKLQGKRFQKFSSCDCKIELTLSKEKWEKDTDNFNQVLQSFYGIELVDKKEEAENTECCEVLS